MLVFVLSVDERFSETENLGYISCNDISIFDKSLSNYQEACLECGDSFKKIIVKTTDISTIKKHIENSEDKYSVFYYENCFFDFSVTNIVEKLNKNIGLAGELYEKDNKLVFSLIDNDIIKKRLINEHSFESIIDLLKSCCLVVEPLFYHKFLNTYASYKKLHFDILNGKTNVYLPNIAKGIYTYGKLPKGDYTIIPPVFISENSQIERGAIVGPNTIVSSNTLVAKNSRVSSCVLCEKTYISEDCVVDNSICGKNASVKRGAAILNNCVLGYDSLVGDGMCIENHAVILPQIQAYSFINKVNNDIKLDYDETRFDNLDVVSACKLGACFGKVFNIPSVCVASDDNNYSKTVKLAFVSGLCSSGCDCFDIGSSFLSKLFYTSLFCQLDYSFYFSFSNNSVSLEIFNEKCEKLNVVNLYNLLFIYRKYKLENMTYKKIKKVKQIKGLSKVYIRDLKSLISSTDALKRYKVSSNNPIIEKLINQLLKANKPSNNSQLKYDFFINNSGDSLTLIANSKSFFHNDLVNAVEILKMQEKTDCLISNLYKKDALVLFLMIVSYVDERDENEKNFINTLEKTAIFEREYSYIASTGKFLNNFLFNNKLEYKNGKLNIINKADNLSLSLNPSTKKIKLITSFSNVAASEEIFKDLDAIINDINKM